MHARCNPHRHLYRAYTFQEVQDEYRIAIWSPEDAQDIRRANVTAATLLDVDSRDPTS